MDLCNLSVIRDLMTDAGISFRKEFGQNFLINRMIPEDIADNCADSSEMMILEIGPGIGCLTQELAQRYRRVVAVEIDNGLIPILGRTMAEYDNVTVINNDIMKVEVVETTHRIRKLGAWHYRVFDSFFDTDYSAALLPEFRKKLLGRW